MRSRSEFTPAQMKKMRLSDETLAGLKVTGMTNKITMASSLYPELFISYRAVMSFVEMARFILRQPGVKFLLSERFCQDPVEVFFGHQRAKGGRNDNPTVKQFCDATVSLRVQSSAALDPIRGNCRKRPADKLIHVSEAPLPKRRRGCK